MKTQIVHMLLNATQHLQERSATVCARVERFHLEINLLLNGDEVIDTFLEEEDGFCKSLDVRIKLVRVPDKLNSFSDQRLDIASHPGHQQGYTRPFLHLQTRQHKHGSDEHCHRKNIRHLFPMLCLTIKLHNHSAIYFSILFIKKKFLHFCLTVYIYSLYHILLSICLSCTVLLGLMTTKLNEYY